MKSYSDLKGDGGSGIVEQVIDQRRRIEVSLQHLDGIVAIGSGKGGVGKSTLTMLLALAIQSSGRAVAVLDADFNGPTQARLGGLPRGVAVPGKNGLVVPKSAGGIGVLSLGSLIPESEALEFPSIARGDSYTWRATREFSLLGDLLAGTDWTPFQILLVDLPPGAEKTFQYAEFFGKRADFVLVTLPSALARGVVQRSIAALNSADGRLLGMIENMAGYLCPGCGKVQPLFPETDGSLEVPVLGRIPFDPALAGLCDMGMTVRDFERLAVGKPISAAADKIWKATREGNRK